MELQELVKVETQKMGDQVMEMQLNQSIKKVHHEILITQFRFKHFIASAAVAILFILTSKFISLLFTLTSLVFLFLAWKSNQKTIKNITSHKMLISFYIKKNIANKKNWWILEKYNVDKYQLQNKIT
jgi:hypothetical protein